LFHCLSITLMSQSAFFHVLGQFVGKLEHDMVAFIEAKFAVHAHACVACTDQQVGQGTQLHGLVKWAARQRVSRRFRVNIASLDLNEVGGIRVVRGLRYCLGLLI